MPILIEINKLRGRENPGPDIMLLCIQVPIMVSDTQDVKVSRTITKDRRTASSIQDEG